MTEVFVSYKRENLAAVGRLVEALRAEGIGVWWDQDIPPNAAWEATIERELAAAKLVVVAWSPAVSWENDLASLKQFTSLSSAHLAWTFVRNFSGGTQQS